MWANLGLLRTRKSSRKGVEHNVPIITCIGLLGPKSPSKSESKNPDIHRTAIWTKKNNTITSPKIERIVFHLEEVCERYRFPGGGESGVSINPCINLVGVQ